MIQLSNGGIYLVHGKNLIPENEVKKVESILGRKVDKEEAHKGTIAYRILEKHNQSSDMKHLKIKFDALTSHDITYVGIIQTAKASGMDKFPMPYILTCCHNSLCAVGGTINEDDHMFGLSAAKKYGGIYVPPHVAVIHQYMREMYAGCGKMILGSDSHTRYGALGTIAVGEGGGELDKQILGDTWVMEGRYDAYLEVELSYQNNIAKENAPYHRFADQLVYLRYKGIPTYALVNKKEVKLCEEVDKAIEELRKDGTIDKLEQKYFGESLQKYLNQK